ncbi:hypothetical protein DPMN_093727 [Dreissena polymorpha]|uniref:Uncharacterized protein n=1 Tax=Dreissena polymorpha TaxID=45954 RepID=A0A9D4L629_DREPO|nr:hypothetical protein DPMN_093727 [Dreissena polymorpha]
MKIRHRNGDPQSKAEMLMARLIDRPANSQVLRMVNSNAQRNQPKIGSEVNGQKESLSQPSTPSPNKVSRSLLSQYL